MPEQLSFDLPVRTAFGRDDFFVSPANAHAVAMIESWEGWPARKLMLVGPLGSGKTHLSHVWAHLSGAQILAAADLAQSDIARLATGPIALEDCDQIAGSPRAENALFHLHNLALAEGHTLLFTAATAPADWPLDLPDLASRMQATPSIHITAPDDALLGALLMKLFADRQLSPTPATLPYLVARIDRSFEAAAHCVDALDAAAMDTRRPITPRLAAEVLDI
ncbi:MAG: chromosomal replication initiator DnaA [Pseudomonadota bacterium]